MNVIHMDLRPENIYLINGVVRISGFSFSIIKDKEDKNSLLSSKGKHF